MVLDMLKRKLRTVGDSLVISIPKQLCAAYNFNEGDYFIIEPIGVNELKLKKSHE